MTYVHPRQGSSVIRGVGLIGDCTVPLPSLPAQTQRIEEKKAKQISHATSLKRKYASQRSMLSMQLICNAPGQRVSGRTF